MGAPANPPPPHALPPPPQPADKVARTVNPDHPDQPVASEPLPTPFHCTRSVTGTDPGGRNWDKIIDYRWLFR